MVETVTGVVSEPEPVSQPPPPAPAPAASATTVGVAAVTPATPVVAISNPVTAVPVATVTPKASIVKAVSTVPVTPAVATEVSACAALLGGDQHKLAGRIIRELPPPPLGFVIALRGHSVVPCFLCIVVIPQLMVLLLHPLLSSYCSKLVAEGWQLPNALNLKVKL